MPTATLLPTLCASETRKNMLRKHAGLLLAGGVLLAHRTQAQEEWTPQCTDMLTMQTLFMPSVMEECCNEAEEDCTNGFPATCNARCAEVLLPLQSACSDFLASSPMWEATKNIIDTAAATCPIVVPTPREREAVCAADINLVRPHYRFVPHWVP